MGSRSTVRSGLFALLAACRCSALANIDQLLYGGWAGSRAHSRGAAAPSATRGRPAPLGANSAKLSGASAALGRRASRRAHHQKGHPGRAPCFWARAATRLARTFSRSATRSLGPASASLTLNCEETTNKRDSERDNDDKTKHQKANNKRTSRVALLVSLLAARLNYTRTDDSICHPHLSAPSCQSLECQSELELEFEFGFEFEMHSQRRLGSKPN